MRRVGLIQQVIAGWFRGRDQAAWDRRMDADSVSGKRDFLFDEADKELVGGFIKECPNAE